MTTAAPTPAAPPLFRDRSLLGWAVGKGVSDLGDVMFFVALTYSAAQLGSPFLAAIVLASGTVPRAVLMLIGGAVSDRVDARRLMIGTDAARVAVLAGALIAIALAGVNAAVLIVVGFLFGVADAFYQPASGIFPRQLVAAEDLPRVAGLRQLSGRVATIGGGPLGLALVAIGGLSAALWADLVSFLVIVVVLIGTRPRWSLPRSGGRSVLADVRGGLTYLARTPRVRDLVLALSGLNVFGAPVLSIGIALRTTDQDWGPHRLGWLTACIGAGAAAGTILMLRYRPARPVRLALALMFVQAAAVAVVGIASYPGEVAAMLVVGLTAGLASPLLAGSVQATVDGEYLGRTTAVLSVADMGLLPLAYAGFGLLVGAAGLAPAAALFGLAFATLMLFSITRPHLAGITIDRGR